MSKLATDNTPKASFLGLPDELRLCIYEAVLDLSVLAHHENNRAKPPALSMLSVSRLTRGEYLPLVQRHCIRLTCRMHGGCEIQRVVPIIITADPGEHLPRIELIQLEDDRSELVPTHAVLYTRHLEFFLASLDSAWAATIFHRGAIWRQVNIYNNRPATLPRCTIDMLDTKRAVLRTDMERVGTVLESFETRLRYDVEQVLCMGPDSKFTSSLRLLLNDFWDHPELHLASSKQEGVKAQIARICAADCVNILAVEIGRLGRKYVELAFRDIQDMLRLASPAVRRQLSWRKKLLDTLPFEATPDEKRRAAEELRALYKDEAAAPKALVRTIHDLEQLESSSECPWAQMRRNARRYPVALFCADGSMQVLPALATT